MCFAHTAENGLQKKSLVSESYDTQIFCSFLVQWSMRMKLSLLPSIYLRYVFILLLLIVQGYWTASFLSSSERCLETSVIQTSSSMQKKLMIPIFHMFSIWSDCYHHIKLNWFGYSYYCSVKSNLNVKLLIDINCWCFINLAYFFSIKLVGLVCPRKSR